jgi:hypothetical protein
MELTQTQERFVLLCKEMGLQHEGIAIGLAIAELSEQELMELIEFMEDWKASDKPMDGYWKVIWRNKTLLTVVEVRKARRASEEQPE